MANAAGDAPRATPWQRRDFVGVFACAANAGDGPADDELGFPAEFEYVRCDLPPEIARHCPQYVTDNLGKRVACPAIPIFAGMPAAMWSRRHGDGSVREYALYWHPADGPMKGRRALQYFKTGPRIGVVAGSLRRRGQRAAGDEQELEKQDARSGSLEQQLLDWHRRLFESYESNYPGSRLALANGLRPIVGANDWRSRARELVKPSESPGLAAFMRANALNFALPDDPASGDVAIYRRALKFYGDKVFVYEFVDSRALPTRTARVLIDHEQGVAASLAASTAPLHEFNQRRADPNRQIDLSDDAKAAQYADFFCRFVHSDVSKDASFPLVCHPSDLRWLRPDDSLPAGRSAQAIKNLRAAEQTILGVWKLNKTQTTRDATTSSPPDGAHSSGDLVMSALVVYGSDLYLCAFEVNGTAGPRVEMLDDVPVLKEPLPVATSAFDPDYQFELKLRPLLKDREHLVQSDELCREVRVENPPANGDETSVDGHEMRRLLLVDNGRGLPSGPADGRWIVRDAIYARGHQKFDRSIVAYGITVRGRVDLREVKIAGTLDLSHCVFEDEVLMQDAEIEGSLNLRGAVFLRGANLRGMIAHGNVKLLGAVFPGPYAEVAGSGIELSGALIAGDLDLRGMSEMGPRVSNWTNASVRLRGARIGGRLLLGSNPHIGRRAPSQVGSFDATGVHVAGDVSWRGGSGSTMPDLTLADSRIGGSFFCGPHDRHKDWQPQLKQQYWSRLDADATDAGAFPKLGNVVFSNCRIAGEVHVACVEALKIDLDLAEIDGAVVIGSEVVWNERKRSQKEAPASRNRGQVRIAHDLNLRGARLRGTLQLRGLWVGGSISLVEALVDGYLFIGQAHADAYPDAVRATAPPSWGLRLEGDLSLSAMIARSHVKLQGVDVGGQVRIINSELGALHLVPAFASRDGGSILTCKLGFLIVTATKVNGNLRMPLLRVSGAGEDNENRGVVLHQCAINGEVSLWQIGTFRELFREAQLAVPSEPQPWDYASAIVGDLKITKCKIEGDCLLSFSKVAGRVDLSDTQVAGDVMFGSRLSHHEALDGDRTLRDRMRDSHADTRSRSFDGTARGYCREFQAGMLQANNDVVLDGLTVAADMLVNYACVKGSVRACSWHPEQRPSLCSSAIEVRGKVELSFGQMTHLIAPGSWRRDVGRAPDPLPQVQLRHSKIGTFEMPTRRDAPGALQPLLLDGTVVHKWDVSVLEGERSVDRLATILGSASSAVWNATEAALRLQGDDDDADALYRHYRKADRANRDAHPSLDSNQREFWRFLKRGLVFIPLWWAVIAAIDLPNELLAMLLVTVAGICYVARPARAAEEQTALASAYKNLERMFDRIYGFVLGYGTRVTAVIMLIATFAAASLPVYWSKQNYEPTNLALAGKWRTQAPDGWTASEAFGSLLHNHVPIVGISTFDDWQMADTDGLSFCLPRLQDLPSITCALEWQVKGMSAQSYATLMQALNWLLWPLFLTFSALKLWRKGPAS